MQVGCFRMVTLLACRLLSDGYVETEIRRNGFQNNGTPFEGYTIYRIGCTRDGTADSCLYERMLLSMVQQLNPFFFLFIHMSNDTTIGYADKIKDMVDFLAHGYLLGNLDDSIFEAEIGRIDKAVGIGDVAQDAVGRLKVL